MLLTLVAVFAACWFPLQLFNILMDFHLALVKILESHENIFLIIFFSCHWLAMANNFTNPLIYGFLNKHFRDDLKGLLRKCRCPSTRQSERRNSEFAMAPPVTHVICRKSSWVTQTYRSANSTTCTRSASPSLGTRVRFNVRHGLQPPQPDIRCKTTGYFIEKVKLKEQNDTS